MSIDASELNSGPRGPQARWGSPLVPFLIEALVLLLVTALVLVLLQLRSSPVVPRILFLLSKKLSSLLGYDKVSGSTADGQSPTEGDGKSVSSSFGPGGLKLKIQSLDHASARRKTRSEFQSRIHDILRIVPDKDLDGLIVTEKYEVNSRGIEIFTKRWIPEKTKPKGAICFCHGYGDTCTFFFEGTARKLASKNYAVFAMDYAGFGLSGGLHGYVPSFDLLVADVNEHYSSLKRQEEFKGLPMFLLGESMGGAVALKAHLSKPSAWDGAVLVAPMCKIAEEMYPPWFVVQFLKMLAMIIPKAKLVPSESIAEIGFRDLEKRQQAKLNMIAYAGKPRLGTALSLLRATDEIERQLDKVSLPLLILHGGADRVTDPVVSQALYKQASSVDKTYHLYEKSWHAVLEGEPDEMIDRAIDDIVKWLDAHCFQ